MNLGIISSFYPQACGVGIFAHRLVESLKKIDKKVNFFLFVIEEKPYAYGEQVKFRIQKDKKEDYVKAARLVNQEEVDIICLQHQFELYGKEGKLTSFLVEELKKPLVSIVHSVPTYPSKTQEKVLLSIGASSDRIVVSLQYAKNLLLRKYGLRKSQVSVIPHPAPDIKCWEKNEAKRKLKLEGKWVVSTFGLIRRDKGIEYAISALPPLVEKSPEVVYLVLGSTHPSHQNNEGESYRQELQALVKKLKLGRNVRFIDKFLSLEEISLYLSATDAYITPYINSEQISSGSLAYAISMGKVCLSTPYRYAEEMLGKGKGILVKFKDSKAITAALTKVKEEESLPVSSYAKKLNWMDMARKYHKIFQEVAFIAE